MAGKKPPKLTLVKGQEKGKDRPLTAKQASFCESIVGINEDEPLTIVDSYRKHYSTDNMSLNAQYVESSRLFNHPMISLRIEHLRTEQEKRNIARNQSRKERVIFNLESLAYDNTNTGHTRVKSLELLGRMAGVDLFRDNHVIEDNRNAQDIKAELEKKLKSLLS